MSDSDVLAGRVAIVTGAGRGIGRGVVTALADAGAHVVAVDRLRSELAAMADDLRSKIGPVLAVEGDVTNDNFVMSLPGLAVQEFGRLDGVVNNAAVFSPCAFLEATLDDLDAVLRVNVRAPFALSQAAARHWVGEGTGGSIVNMSSISASVAQPTTSHYSTSKAGLEHGSRVMALELAPHRIRVNCIAPGGPIDTEYVRAVMADNPTYAKRRPPIGRLGQPADVGAAVVYLLSDSAAFVTGAVLTVDGGLSLGILSS